MSLSLDREKLGKLLALAGSNHDGEALAAVRKAGQMVAAAGLEWRDVLASESEPFGSCIDQAITTPAGLILVPPIGATWSETTRRLWAADATRDVFERNLLLHLIGKVARFPATVPLSAVEAQFLIRLYDAWCKEGARE